MGESFLMGQQKPMVPLLERLMRAFPERKGPWDLGVAFSGGLDSTVLTAAAMERYGDRVRLHPIVVGLSASHDLDAAKRAAEELGLELDTNTITPEEVIGSVRPVTGFTGTTDPVVISFTIPLFLVLKAKGPKEVMVGHGADELFGGYARYLEVPPHRLQERLDADLVVLEDRVGSDRCMARELGKELLTPYLDRDLIEAVKGLPPEQKVSGGVRKVALRTLARELGLSDRLSDMGKKAAQYGSGVMKVLKQEVKRRDLDNVGDLVAELART